MNIAEMYENCLVEGWLGPEIAKDQWNLLKSSSSFKPFGIQSSATRKMFLHQVVRKVLGHDLENIAQQVGDCFIAGTKVTMSDGTLKNIEDVKIGDEVISHTNKRRKVLNTIKKNYSGELVTINGKGHTESIISTPDHRFMKVPVTGHETKHKKIHWNPIGEMNIGDKILIPFGLSEENIHEHIEVFKDQTSLSKLNPTKEIEINEDFARLLGLYLAEGGVSSNETGPYRLEFSLSRLEQDLAEEIVYLIDKIFNLKAKIVYLPSKPTVTLVRCANTDLARFFKRIIKGNVYSKEIPSFIFRSSTNVRMALFNGWIDGDGSRKKEGCVSGVSASKELINDMHRLCRSCKLRPMFHQRKQAAHQTVASCEVSIYGQSAKSKKMRDIGEFGRAIAIKSIEKQNVQDIFVYCLEVEEDHSFIANGFAVHNCVSWGMRNCICYLQTVQQLLLGKRETFKDVFPPYLYGTGRVFIGKNQISGDGSLGSWMAEGVIKYGILNSDEQGVPGYSGTIARQWGRSPGPPQKFVDIGKTHPVKSATKINSWDELVTAIVNGYPCTVASNQGFTMKAGSDGFMQASGSWAHQMCITGVDDEYSQPYALIRNSWGDSHGVLTDFYNGDKLPVGYIRAKKSIVENMIRAGETFAISNFEGFPSQEQEIKKELFKLI